MAAGNGPSTVGMDDNTLLAAYAGGAIVSVSGAVLLAAPLPPLCPGTGGRPVRAASPQPY